MEDLFGTLLLLSMVALGLGLISPSLIAKIVRRELNRKKILLYFGGAIVAFFVLFGIFSDSSTSVSVIETQIETQEITDEQMQVVEDQEEIMEDEELVAIQPVTTSSVTVVPQQQTQEISPPQPQSTQINCLSGQVDVNSASKEELKLIIHIDDNRADDLIRLRPYKSLDGLTKINGIGTARLNDIKEQNVACVN